MSATGATRSPPDRMRDGEVADGLRARYPTEMTIVLQHEFWGLEIEDDRWLGKVFKGQHFFDVIFASSNGTMPIGRCSSRTPLRKSSSM